MTNIFQTILRNNYAQLPAPVRRFHEARIGSFDGTADVTGSTGAMARMLRWMFGLPPPASQIPVNVKVIRSEVEERWLRQWGEHRFSSKFNRLRKGNLLCENLGMVKLHFDLIANERQLRWRLLEWSLAGIPMPLSLGPDIVASESGDDEGNYRFSVKVTYAGIGELTSYEGFLRVNQGQGNQVNQGA